MKLDIQKGNILQLARAEMPEQKEPQKPELMLLGVRQTQVGMTARVWTTLRVQHCRGPSQGELHNFLVSLLGVPSHDNSK